MQRIVLIAVMGFASLACGAPFVPASDAEVVEVLPAGADPALARLKRMHAATRARPHDATLAATFARRAIEASRATGDPRYLGQARGALGPRWNEADAPLEIIVLRATIKQSLHDFEGALADLDRVIAAAPAHAQARLTRAMVRNVTARHAEALADCDALQPAVPASVRVACRADVVSRVGGAGEAYPALATTLRSLARDDAHFAWASTIAGEIAARRGDAAAAETHFRAALAQGDDPYTLGVYADLLLDRRRPHDVVTLLEAHTRHDALLLRIVIALRAIDARAYESRRAELAARIEAARRRGDDVHRREEARYALAIENDPALALRLALANWRVQREPADARLLAEAARATGDAAALRTVVSFVRTTRLEDVALASLLQGGV